MTLLLQKLQRRDFGVEHFEAAGRSHAACEPLGLKHADLARDQHRRALEPPAQFVPQPLKGFRHARVGAGGGQSRIDQQSLTRPPQHVERGRHSHPFEIEIPGAHELARRAAHDDGVRVEPGNFMKGVRCHTLTKAGGAPIDKQFLTLASRLHLRGQTRSVFFGKLADMNQGRPSLGQTRTTAQRGCAGGLLLLASTLACSNEGKGNVTNNARDAAVAPDTQVSASEPTQDADAADPETDEAEPTEIATSEPEPTDTEGTEAEASDVEPSTSSSVAAPATSWVNATGNLAGMASECGNLTLLSAVPDSDAIIAGVAKVGLFMTRDGGEHWEPLGTGAGSASITNRPSAIVYDPEHPGTFWESGIYNGGGVYQTTDDGATFQQLGDIGHNDLVSIDFGDPERTTLLVGGHEQKQTLYLSTNGGLSFEQIGATLPADSHFSSAPLVLSDKTFLLGACGYGDGTCGIYRSEDAGDSWERVSELAATARPLWASDGSIYWPLIYNGGLARGTADGTSWTQVADGSVTAPPVELPDGRILTLKGRDVVMTADQGAQWILVGEPLPFDASGVVYNAQTKTLFAWHWDCGDSVLPDAIASAGFDHTAN